MTKLEIVNNVVKNTGLSRKKAEAVVEEIIEKIKDTIAAGDTVILRRFGSFSVLNKNARVGRNPKTGEDADICARRVVRFKAGKYFKEVVDN